MLTFNNTNIFTGYLKQLLQQYSLPKYRVCTAKQEKILADYQEEVVKYQKEVDLANTALAEFDGLEDKSYLGDEEAQAKIRLELVADYQTALNNLNTYRNITLGTLAENYIFKSDYSKHQYIPYIHANDIAVRIDDTWRLSSNTHISSTTRPVANRQDKFIPGLLEPNYTRHLALTGDSYDTYTHEYLGDYLRFQRDYYNVDLMPLYNCFSNQVCPQLTKQLAINNFIADFDTSDTRYKIYMVPVKLFKKYTIAIDCESDIEMFCGLYHQYYQNKIGKDTSLDTVNTDTYLTKSNASFNNPFVYDKLITAFTKYIDSTDGDSFLSTLSLFENNLKLFIKLPANNTSSITILEGDYTAYQDTMLTVERSKFKRITNHAVINFEPASQDGKAVDFEDIDFALPTTLQLLLSNSEVSHPFADRLIEYLTGNAITPLDPNGDNVERAKTVISNRYYAEKQAGKHPADTLNIEVDPIWENKMRLLFYTYMNSEENTLEYNHDILGYVDKDVEQKYSAVSKNPITGETEISTIARVDIYENRWED